MCKAMCVYLQIFWIYIFFYCHYWIHDVQLLTTALEYATVNNTKERY